ncbi:hypothetical protein DP939_16780 [Spongiactinospora rosea]|uniref:Uncharacterized protein n=1 Tax=Spongiactinospora rosea TaxID=2248750 RepID=A0A366LZT2_9ACTN|nr:hypothetical protein DP939_16780 [Spongiactinospora rosea]
MEGPCGRPRRAVGRDRERPAARGPGAARRAAPGQCTAARRAAGRAPPRPRGGRRRRGGAAPTTARPRPGPARAR